MKIIFRLGLVICLFLYSWYFLTATMLELGDKPGFMHMINLVFHEAGHAVLFWAPQLLCSFGGTLGQLVVPLAIAIAFLVQKDDRFSATVCMWWFGQSLVDVAPYVNDARASRLILLGGATGTDIEGHDWMYILDQLNILSMDVRIARVVLASGRVIMVLSLLVALFLVFWCYFREKKQQES